MPQHDFEITTADANTGLTVRAQLNAAFQALASCSAGSSSPATMYANQLWADWTNGIMKQRDSTNTTWTQLFSLDTNWSAFFRGLVDATSASAFLATLGITAAMDLVDVIDCAESPDYPSASKGDCWVVSVAGIIGGASGIEVEIGQTILCLADSEGGSQAVVGDEYTILQTNLDMESFLALDQTTPQTIINGFPLYEDGHAAFSGQHQLVDKEYVDSALPRIGARYYMLDAADGTVGAYKQCSMSASALETASVNASANAETDTLIEEWISPAGQEWTSLEAGVYDLNVFAAKTAGNRDVRIFWKFYERKSDTSEVLIATSNLGDLVADKARFRVFCTLAETYTPSENSRLVGKVYFNTDGGSQNTTCYLYYQGDEDSQWEIPVSKEFLDDTYVANSLFDVQSILAAVSDDTPVAVTVAEQTLVGRITAGDIDDLSVTQIRTLINVADGATANAKATGAEINTGTNDVKFATAKAIADSTITTPTKTQTLTNKRVTKRTVEVTSHATPTLNTDNADIATILVLATAITNMSTNISGTPVAGADMLLYRIKDNGTARAITWGDSFEAYIESLPTTTVQDKELTVLFLYRTKWSCVYSDSEA